MKPTRYLSFFILAALLCVHASAASADVIVLANRTAGMVQAKVTLPGEGPRLYKLDPKQVVPVPVVDEAAIVFKSGNKTMRRRVAANSIVYFFTREATPDVVEYAEQHFGDKRLPDKPKPAAKAELARLRKVFNIPVKLLVDDDEPAVKMLWEKRLTDRIEQASDILQKFAFVRLKVVETDTWDSQDGVVDFKFSIREFEREVRPGAKAALAIGFTSQYKKPNGRVHMGGTRGPLHPYILIREWSQHVAYAHRMEIVVHEMGHVLGAAHSPDKHSVMRPLVSDGHDRDRRYKTDFDPLNTLAMFLFCEELRLHKAVSLWHFRPERRKLLERVYAEMQKHMPKDNSPSRYMAFLKMASKPLPKRTKAGNPVGRIVTRQQADPAKAKTLVAATRFVLDALLHAAEANHDLSGSPSSAQNGSSDLILNNKSQTGPLAGDRLTEYYVRTAARAAEQLPPEHASKAFLLGLAIGLCNSDDFQNQKAMSRFVELIESEDQRRRRLDVLGNPTMRGRSDLAKHFAVSAALTALVGEDGTRTIAIAKESADSRGGSGFSFRDLAADMAGICFAKNIAVAKQKQQQKQKLSDIAATFLIDGFMPSVDDLPEGLSKEEFEKRFGSTADKRFQDEEAAIRRAILGLPGYMIMGR